MRLRAISIHSSNCARPFVHRLRWPCEEIESATNLEASGRIDRAREGEDARAQCPRQPPGCDQPSTKKSTFTRSLARSFAPSCIRSYDSFESASASSFPCTARGRRTRDRPNNATPLPPFRLPPSRPALPPCPPSIHETSARARVRAAEQRRGVCPPHSLRRYPLTIDHTSRRIGWLSPS